MWLLLFAVLGAVAAQIPGLDQFRWPGWYLCAHSAALFLFVSVVFKERWSDLRHGGRGACNFRNISVPYHVSSSCTWPCCSKKAPEGLSFPGFLTFLLLHYSQCRPVINISEHVFWGTVYKFCDGIGNNTWVLGVLMTEAEHFEASFSYAASMPATWCDFVRPLPGFRSISSIFSASMVSSSLDKLCIPLYMCYENLQGHGVIFSSCFSTLFLRYFMLSCQFSSRMFCKISGWILKKISLFAGMQKVIG